jgi:hypothetical protein
MTMDEDKALDWLRNDILEIKDGLSSMTEKLSTFIENTCSE